MGSNVERDDEELVLDAEDDGRGEEIGGRASGNLNSLAYIYKRGSSADAALQFFISSGLHPAQHREGGGLR